MKHWSATPTCEHIRPWRAPRCLVLSAWRPQLCKTTCASHSVSVPSAEPDPRAWRALASTLTGTLHAVQTKKQPTFPTTWAFLRLFKAIPLFLFCTDFSRWQQGRCSSTRNRWHTEGIFSTVWVSWSVSLSHLLLWCFWDPFLKFHLHRARLPPRNPKVKTLECEKLKTKSTGLISLRVDRAAPEQKLLLKQKIIQFCYTCGSHGSLCLSLCL